MRRPPTPSLAQALIAMLDEIGHSDVTVDAPVDLLWLTSRETVG